VSAEPLILGKLRMRAERAGHFDALAGTFVYVFGGDGRARGRTLSTQGEGARNIMQRVTMKLVRKFG